MSEARPYDIVLFGATGFTGGLTAEYLAKHAPPGVRLAIAGRSAEKLMACRERMRALSPSREVGVLTASVDDESSLAAMARSTRVLLSTVGPFIDYGEPVVRACVQAGTDYIDSTGEPHFYALVCARYDADAQARGVRVVPSCGFDSIPTDLGALYTISQLPSDQAIELSGYMKVDARFSGGTERSALKALMPPPHGLTQPARTPEVGREVKLLLGKVERRSDVGGWVAPLPTLDPIVVLRSAASLRAYGPKFSYAHHAVHGPLIVLLAAGLVFGGVALLVRIPAVAALLLKLVKKSGQGPSAERRAKSWFRLAFVARSGGTTVRTEVTGGDPGYDETSKMLAEAALCLALDREALPARGGVLTPAEAMGERLLERITRAGLEFRTLAPG